MATSLNRFNLDLMSKKEITLSLKATKGFSLTLEPISGGITLFYAFINGVKVIQSDGSKKRSWKGKIPDAQVRIKVKGL